MSSAKKTGDEPRKSMKERLTEHIQEYGSIAIIIFFSISIATIAGFYIAIKAGFEPKTSVSGDAGTLFVAWVAAKFTMPLRILATFVLTPPIAALHKRFKRKRSD